MSKKLSNTLVTKLVTKTKVDNLDQAITLSKDNTESSKNKIFGYIKELLLYKSSGQASIILEYLDKIWKASGTVVVNDDIAHLIYSTITPNDSVIQYCYMFMETYDEYVIGPNNECCHLVNIFRCILDNTNKIPVGLLELAFKRKNFGCIIVILDLLDVSIATFIRVLVKYDVYVAELGCRLGEYIINNHVKMMVTGYYVTKNIERSFKLYPNDPNMILIIRKHFEVRCEEELEVCNIFANIATNIYDMYECDTQVQIWSIALDVLEKYTKVHTDWGIETLDQDSPIMIYGIGCTKIINRKHNLRNKWNIDIAHVSRLDVNLIYLLLMIAKDTKYRRSGFKYIMRQIIEYYYCLY